MIIIKYIKNKKFKNKNNKNLLNKQYQNFHFLEQKIFLKNQNLKHILMIEIKFIQNLKINHFFNFYIFLLIINFFNNV